MTSHPDLELILFGLLWLGGAVAAALIIHEILMRIAVRISRRSSNGIDDLLIQRGWQPLRFMFVTLATMTVIPRLELDGAAKAIVAQILALIVPCLVGWLVASLLGAMKDVVELRSDISVTDNLRARQARTRIGVLYRIGVAVVVVVTICMMLMTIPSVRSVGITLFASAGLAGLAVGAAAQPALKNLIAGIQLAFTEPIRIDDVVIMAGEWGRIEEIRLSYVVVRIWDERRLIVPVSKFLEEPFQNWTRETSQILDTAMFYVDYAVDVPALRAKLEEIVAASPLWDKRVVGLQVTDLRERTMELRALVSAADASAAFDLRCEVREKMIAHIVETYPEALPRQRLEKDDATIL